MMREKQGRRLRCGGVLDMALISSGLRIVLFEGMSRCLELPPRWCHGGVVWGGGGGTWGRRNVVRFLVR